MKTPVLLALAALALATGAAQAKVLRVPMTAQAPTIDGSAREALWRQAAVADGFLLEDTGGVPAQPTTVRFICDGRWLYIAVRCAEPDLDGMTVKAAKPDAVWSDDFVEVHIEVINARRGFDQFAINPAGVRTPDAMARNARIATARGDGEWTAEIALDLRDLGVRHLGTPVRWALNIGRVRHNGGPNEETSVWNGAPGSVDDPAVMGDMIIGPPGEVTVEGLEIEAPRWGPGNRLRVRVSNQGAAQPVRVFARPINVAAGEQGEVVTSRLRPAAAQDVPGRFTLMSLGGRQRLGISLLSESGRTLYRLWRGVEIAPLLSLRPVRPWYRGLIPPDMQHCEFRVEAGLTEEALAHAQLRVRAYSGPWSSPTRIASRYAGQREQVARGDLLSPPESPPLFDETIPAASGVVTFPADALPYGDSVLWVECGNAGGKRLAQVSMPLRRLAPEQASALPTHVDEHSRLIVDGKPFFPLGWYSGHRLEHLREIAASPFNCILDYGINHLSLDGIRDYLDAAAAHGVKLIYCLNDLYPAATYHRQIGPWTGNADMARGVVSTFRDHPAIIAWYLNDELPVKMIPELMGYYDLVRGADPGHPAFVVHFVPDIIADFAPTTDVMGIDIYPVPTRPLARVAERTDTGIAAVGGRKPLWMVLQAFAWYQYREPEDPQATGGRGRIPTESELRTGRAPTREEGRCMTYLALTHGAMGLIYYCYYDLRVLPQYEEMWGWLKGIGAEVKELSPALLSTVTLPVQVRGDAAKLHALLKEHEGKWYLLTVNGEPTPARGEFVLPGAAAAARVLFEEREARVAGRVLADDFAPYAAHVYEITPARAGP